MLFYRHITFLSKRSGVKGPRRGRSPRSPKGEQERASTAAKPLPLTRLKRSKLCWVGLGRFAPAPALRRAAPFPPGGKGGGMGGMVARDGRGTKAPGLVDVPHVPVMRQAPKASALGGRFGDIQPMRGSESRRNTRGLGSCRRTNSKSTFALDPTRTHSDERPALGPACPGDRWHVMPDVAALRAVT